MPEILDEPRCPHSRSELSQGLAGPHEVLEVVLVGRREYVRRCETHPCPAHLAAIRRARRFSEQPQVTGPVVSALRLIEVKTHVHPR